MAPKFFATEPPETQNRFGPRFRAIALGAQHGRSAEHNSGFGRSTNCHSSAQRARSRISHINTKTSPKLLDDLTKAGFCQAQNQDIPAVQTCFSLCTVMLDESCIEAGVVKHKQWPDKLELKFLISGTARNRTSRQN